MLVQPRKTCPFITERLLKGGKESNKKKTNISVRLYLAPRIGNTDLEVVGWVGGGGGYIKEKRIGCVTV